MTEPDDTAAPAPDTLAPASLAAETLAATPATESTSEPAADSAPWPDDWRERLAGADDTLLRHLKRYASPDSYARAGYEAQQKIRAGEASKLAASGPPGADAPPGAPDARMTRGAAPGRASTRPLVPARPAPTLHTDA